MSTRQSRKMIVVAAMAAFSLAEQVAGGDTNGILCLTFDDRNLKAWMDARPLFKKYNAHATFFVQGAIDANAIEVMKALVADGHTVGLHSVSHRDPATALKKGMTPEEYLAQQVFPQLDACRKAGLKITSFACPNNDRDEKTDAMLRPYFKRIRAGIRPWRDIPYPLSEIKGFLVPPDEFRMQLVHHALGIGKYYGSRLPQLLECVDDLAEKNLCASFFSHNIREGEEMGFVDITRPMLEAILKRAQEKGVRTLSFDDLDATPTKTVAVTMGQVLSPVNELKMDECVLPHTM